jgi:hypothetical protein
MGKYTPFFTLKEGGFMQQNQGIVNPDVVCQQAVQAKLNVFR